MGVRATDLAKEGAMCDEEVFEEAVLQEAASSSMKEAADAADDEGNDGDDVVDDAANRELAEGFTDQSVVLLLLELHPRQRPANPCKQGVEGAGHCKWGPVY